MRFTIQAFSSGASSSGNSISLSRRGEASGQEVISRRRVESGVKTQIFVRAPTAALVLDDFEGVGTSRIANEGKWGLHDRQ
jgi:hypothetical protein